MNRLNAWTRMAWSAALILPAGSALAHTGSHVVTGFAGGLAHPLTGLDHLLAMLAVGLWAAQQGGRALLGAPATFVAAMGLGAWLAGSGWVMPHIEAGVALSVLLLGLLIATRRQGPLYATLGLVGVFALFHGGAHGLEMPSHASPVLYSLGYLMTTLLLHAAGMAGSLAGRHAVRMAGWGVAASGLVLVMGA